MYVVALSIILYIFTVISCMNAMKWVGRAQVSKEARCKGYVGDPVTEGLSLL